MRVVLLKYFFSSIPTLHRSKRSTSFKSEYVSKVECALGVSCRQSWYVGRKHCLDGRQAKPRRCEENIYLVSFSMVTFMVYICLGPGHAWEEIIYSSSLSISVLTWPRAKPWSWILVLVLVLVLVMAMVLVLVKTNICQPSFSWPSRLCRWIQLCKVVRSWTKGLQLYLLTLETTLTSFHHSGTSSNFTTMQKC